MSKCPVGFCHPVCIFLPLDSSTFILAGGDDLRGKLFSVTFATPGTGKVDHPLHPDRDLALGTHLDGDLERGTSDPLTPHLDLRHHIIQVNRIKAAKDFPQIQYE